MRFFFHITFSPLQPKSPALFCTWRTSFLPPQLASRRDPQDWSVGGRQVLCSATHTGPRELRAQQQAVGRGDPAAQPSLWQAVKGPLPQTAAETLCAQEPWSGSFVIITISSSSSSSSARGTPVWRKATCCRLSSCQLPRPGIRVSFTKLGHRRLLHKMGLLIIPALLARRIRSAARVLA